MNRELMACNTLPNWVNLHQAMILTLTGNCHVKWTLHSVRNVLEWIIVHGLNQLGTYIVHVCMWHRKSASMMQLRSPANYLSYKWSQCIKWIFFQFSDQNWFWNEIFMTKMALLNSVVWFIFIHVNYIYSYFQSFYVHVQCTYVRRGTFLGSSNAHHLLFSEPHFFIENNYFT